MVEPLRFWVAWVSSLISWSLHLFIEYTGAGGIWEAGAEAQAWQWAAVGPIPELTVSGLLGDRRHLCNTVLFLIPMRAVVPATPTGGL